ncbi:MAG TPA: DUF3999 family protein [Burkholderiaceae bacterium]|jgi:hypothetical protein|nr:DUF3999 family protein [Burkholderiaceae bacterium]
MSAAAPARDLTAADFDWHATVSTERTDGLHQLQLGEDALLAATASGPRDLRIFNANGEALPVAQLPAVAPPAEHGVTVALRMAPLPGSQQAQDRTLADYALRLVRDRDHTVLEIGANAGSTPASATHDPGGFLLDLRPLKDEQGELVLQFAAGAPDYANTATISGSDDLVSWHLLVSGPLARNRQLGGAAVEHSSFELNHPPAFARVQWPAGAAPKLDAASFRQRLPPRVAPASQTALQLSALPDGRWLVDLPPALPLWRIAIHVAQPNQALKVDLLCPSSGGEVSDREHLLRELSGRTSSQPWFACVRGVHVYRVDRSGEWVENLPVAIPGHPAHLLVHVIDPPDYRGPPPDVEEQWQPVRLAFLARAPGPYQLAVGHEGAGEGPRLDLAGMLSGEDPAGTNLPRAQVTPSGPADMKPAAARAAQLARNQARWRWSLWAVLLVAVGALAALAWRVAKSIRGAGG